MHTKSNFTADFLHLVRNFSTTFFILRFLTFFLFFSSKRVLTFFILWVNAFYEFSKCVKYHGSQGIGIRSTRVVVKQIETLLVLPRTRNAADQYIVGLVVYGNQNAMTFVALFSRFRFGLIRLNPI